MYRKSGEIFIKWEDYGVCIVVIGSEQTMAIDEKNT